MASVGNIVLETGTGSGTSSLTLAAFPFFRRFSTAFGTGAGNTFYYCIRHRAQNQYEVGIGYCSAANTLVRSSVIESSNANALVNFSAGNKDVISDIPASLQIRGTMDSSNAILGEYSGPGTTTPGFTAGAGATDNFIHGRGAGGSLGTGSNNFIAGTGAGRNLVGDHDTGLGADNVLIGRSTGAALVDHYDNIFIGYQAGKNTEGNLSVVIGNSANQTGLGGDHNVVLGANAAINNTGSNVIYIGYNVGASDFTKDNYLNIGDILFGDLTLGIVKFGGFAPTSSSIVSVSSSPYAITTAEYLLLVNTSSAKTLNLPDPTLYSRTIIKDVTGSASTNNITLARFGSENIEGLAADKVLATNFGSWTLQSDGTNWWMI